MILIIIIKITKTILVMMIIQNRNTKLACDRDFAGAVLAQELGPALAGAGLLIVIPGRVQRLNTELRLHRPA